MNKQQALSILETLLSWTENAMIRQGDRYVILPSNQAVAGKLVPEMPVARPSTGLTARLFPLRYISATEMQKLLKPFARENAFLLVDPARNVLSLAGTPDELTNYQDTIDLRRRLAQGHVHRRLRSAAGIGGRIDAATAKLFGPDSGIRWRAWSSSCPTNAPTPLSPFRRSRRICKKSVTGSRPSTRGRQQAQMYVYDVRNMKASDLAKYLRQIYGNGAIKEDVAAKVAPGLRTTSLSSLNGSGNGLPARRRKHLPVWAPKIIAQSSGEEEEAEDYSSGDESGDSESADTAESGGQAGAQSLQQSVRITAQKSTSQLLVRTRPAQWKRSSRPSSGWTTCQCKCRSRRGSSRSN